jgi:hypothetical protein
MDQPLQVWANVSDKARTKKVWIEIRKPNIFLINGEIQQTIDLDYKPLSYSELSGRYEATIEASYFDRPGKYTLFFYVKEDNDIVLPTQWLFVYKAKDNNLPPSHFSLKSPENESTVRTSTILSWESAYDTDRLSYSIFLFKKNIPPHELDKIEKHGIEKPMFSIDLPETWDKYKIYWYIRAIDEFGAYTDTDTWSFNTDNTGKEDSFIKGNVFSSLTEKEIKSANVMLYNNDDTYFPDTNDGFYWGQYPEGTYEIKAFNGCYDANALTITLQKGKLHEQNIRLIPKSIFNEIDCDERFNLIDLNDIIASLKILSDVDIARGDKQARVIGLIPKWNLNEMDISCDERIDLIDVIVLSKILSVGVTTKEHFHEIVNCKKNLSFELFICSMKKLCGF